MSKKFSLSTVINHADYGDLRYLRYPKNDVTLTVEGLILWASMVCVCYYHSTYYEQGVDKPPNKEYRLEILVGTWLSHSNQV